MPDHENLNRDHYLRILDPWREEWEKGVQVPVNADALPQAKIKLLDTCCDQKDGPSTSKSPVHKQAPTNAESTDDHSFKLPKHYIKDEYESSTPTNLYELDLQDICWLETLNAELSIKISDTLLEDVVNELEQHCARNIKEQQMGIEYNDHIVCDVCQNPDAEDDNEMVFCENCNICVHQACYGIVDIPLGDWFCNSCRDLGSKKNAVCVLCPNVGGAMKPTTNSKWCHVSCAFWVPEVKFLETQFLEPIETKDIPNWRWGLMCSLCNVKKGTPILCDTRNCRAAYHVTCAFKHKLKMKLVISDASTNVLLKSYCPKHSLDHLHTNVNSAKEVDFISRSVSDEEKLSHTNPQYEFWKYVEISKIYQEICKKYLSESETSDSLVKDCTITPKVLQQIVDLIHNYWKLKRISNYGNSLIKPTFAQKFEEEMHIQHTKLIEFRYHLERLRTLTYMVTKRERLKHRFISTQKEVFENACKVFLGVDLSAPASTTTTSSTSSETSSIQQLTPTPAPVANNELFLQILKHDNIYLSAPEVGEPEPQSVAFSGAAPPVEPSTSSFVDEPKSGECTPSIGTSSCASQDGRSLRKQNESSYKNLTNHILRQLKRLSRAGSFQGSSKTIPNPYARVYMSSANKRKPNELENGFSEMSAQSDSSQIDEADEVKFSESFKSKVCKSPPSTSKAATSHQARKYEIVSRAKRKLDLAAAEEISQFNSDQIKSRSLSLSPRKLIKMEDQTDKEDEPKRVYNFRKSISNDVPNGDEASSKLMTQDSNSSQKENGLDQNYSPANRVGQRELTKLGLLFEKGKLKEKQFNDLMYTYRNGSQARMLPKSLRSNSENVKTNSTNFLSTEIKNRFRHLNNLNGSRRLTSN